MRILIKRNDWYQPYDSKDMVLFQHCAEGAVAVKVEIFETSVKQLLKLHGVDLFNFIYEEELSDE